MGYAAYAQYARRVQAASQSNQTQTDIRRTELASYLLRYIAMYVTVSYSYSYIVIYLANYLAC